MAGGVVALDIPAFRAEFPQFADETAWPDAMLQAQWRVAGRFVDNSETSRLPYEFRADVLPFVLCHLLALTGRNGGLMGALTSATQGSVSAGSTWTPRQNAAWWQQTQCGATAWELLLPYRTGGHWITGGCHGCQL